MAEEIRAAAHRFMEDFGGLRLERVGVAAGDERWRLEGPALGPAQNARTTMKTLRFGIEIETNREPALDSMGNRGDA